MTSATEKLRKLLEERGVKWRETINHANCIFTWWESPTFGIVHAMDNEDGETLFMACLNSCDFTPEQAIAATLGSGTLTAEHVKRIHEIIEKHWHDLPDEYDMLEATALSEYSYNWQAIADELNATLGGGECELVYGENDHGDDGWWCQSCGEWFAASFRHTGRNNIIEPSYCQHCGKAVER